MSPRKSDTINFGTAKAAPGEKAWGRLNVKEGSKQARLGVCAINGSRPGEHVLFLANQHGTEINGVEAIRRFCEDVDPTRIKGSVFCVFSANPTAAMQSSAVWNEGDKVDPKEAGYRSSYNMNFNWPAKKGGLLVQRACHEIWSRGVDAPHRKASLVVDLHCHQKPTAVYATNAVVADLGIVAGIPIVVNTGGEGDLPTLCGESHRQGIMGICIELGGQMTLKPESIETGRRALHNLLRFKGMAPGRLSLPDSAIIEDPWRDQREAGRKFAGPSFLDHVAKASGLVVPHKGDYECVRKGEVMCDVMDPFTGKVVETCRAEITGSIYNYRAKGYVVEKGEKVYTLAVTKRVKPREYVRKLNPTDFVYASQA